VSTWYEGGGGGASLSLETRGPRTPFPLGPPATALTHMHRSGLRLPRGAVRPALGTPGGIHRRDGQPFACDKGAGHVVLGAA